MQKNWLHRCRGNNHGNIIVSTITIAVIIITSIITAKITETRLENKPLRRHRAGEVSHVSVTFKLKRESDIRVEMSKFHTAGIMTYRAYTWLFDQPGNQGRSQEFHWGFNMGRGRTNEWSKATSVDEGQERGLGKFLDFFCFEIVHFGAYLTTF